MSSGLLQVFVELGNLHGTSNYVLYWNHGGRLFWFRLAYPGTSVKNSCILLACSEDWTCNLQMIVFLEAQGTKAYNHVSCWKNSMFYNEIPPKFVINNPIFQIVSFDSVVRFHSEI